ncbi:oxidoreductase [Nocardioides hungaricus]
MSRTPPADRGAGPALFSPVRLGALRLPNRVVMAPLTRLRADAGGVPGDLVAAHYAQRASVGMIVTEGVFPARRGRAYAGQPGLESDEQSAGWARVVEAVHARGGVIVAQLMHAGRVSHPELLGGLRPVAPSPLGVRSQHGLRTPSGKRAYPVPAALTRTGIDEVVTGFAAAARRAVGACFDGVELHFANGYLVHQFLSPHTNVRSDGYGGGPDGRARLAVEVAAAVAAETGADRLGVRISPMHDIQDVVEDDEADVVATYGVLSDHLRHLGIAYLSVIHEDLASPLVQGLRARSGAGLVANSGLRTMTRLQEADRLVAGDLCEAVAVGRGVIANPDLVGRWRDGHDLNPVDPATFYTGGPRGYTDYPALADH